MKQKTKPASIIFKSSSSLAKLKTRLMELKELNELLNQILPQELKNHCHVANLREGNLVLATSSPAWYHNLRFVKSELLSKARKIPKFSGIKSISIITQPEEIVEDPKYKITSNPMPPVSSYTADTIKSAAENIKDKNLSEILQKIATHTNKNHDCN